jgi:hypothetical protein
VIVVDTSVWVDLLKGRATREVGRLRQLLGAREILMGDLILTELLQGFRTDADALLVRRQLDAFPFAPMVGREVALRAADYYRMLRRRGITVRKTIDLLIGTFCIEHGHALLHADRDFEPLAAHLGLRVM